MEIRFGGIVFTFKVNAERTIVTIDRPEEYGFSGEGRDMSTAIVNAVIDVLESEIKHEGDFEIRDLAIEALACAYAAGIMNDFEAVHDTTFIYRGAIYYVESQEGRCVAFRHMEMDPVPLGAFVLKPEEKTWMGFAQAAAHQKEEERKAVEKFLDGPEYNL